MPFSEIDILPDPPQRDGDPDTFADLADTFVVALQTFTEQINVFKTELEAAAALINAAPAYADAMLLALADGNTPAADKLPYLTGATSSAVTDFTSVARTLLAQATQATMRSVGLGFDLDTDTALAANSDIKVATQKATKAYVDTAVTGLLDFKGSTDCSANPNYPAALKGDAYIVSVAGKIGGASGKSVDVGDVYVASADNAGGTEASVGTSWFVLEHNLQGALLAANNLSDIPNGGTALANLGLTFTSDANGIAIGIPIGGTTYYIQAGTKTQGANSDGTITYPVAFTTVAYCACIGGPSGSGDAGTLHTRGASGLTTQNVSNTSGGASITGNWVAVGY